MNRRTRIRELVLGLIWLSVPGCWDGAPRLTPVRGKVSYLGRPLQGGMIVFTPDAAHGNRGPIAHGQIQPDGSFSLQTGEDPGAVCGWHRVTVAAVSESPPPADGSRFHIPPSLLPEKYRSPELSGLESEVKAGEENVFEIDLR